MAVIISIYLYLLTIINFLKIVWNQIFFFNKILGATERVCKSHEKLAHHATQPLIFDL